MLVQDYIRALQKSGVEIGFFEDKIEVEGPLNQDSIEFLKGNNTAVLNHLYGLNDIQRGVELADIHAGRRGYAIAVTPQSNQVGFKVKNTPHPIYRKIWDVVPIIDIRHKDNLIKVPHDRREWSNLLVIGLQIISGLDRSSVKHTSPAENRNIENNEAYLTCDWNTLSTWKFAQYLQNYLHSIAQGGRVHG